MLLGTGLLVAPAHAAPAAPRTRWQTLETEHFVFHWPRSADDDLHPFTTESTVARLAELGEQAWPRLEGVFGQAPDQRVHVTVRDDDWAGEGRSEANQRWIGVGAQPGPTFRPRGRMEHLESTLVHELTHVFSLNMARRFSPLVDAIEIGVFSEDKDWVQRLAGPTPVTPGIEADVGLRMIYAPNLPAWWVEGGAEYWVERAGYGSWGSSREAFLRVTVRDDLLLPRAGWRSTADKTGFDRERVLNQGYAFARYLEEELGEDVLTRMAQAADRRSRRHWDGVVREVTGRSTRQLYGTWRRKLERRVGDDIARMEMVGLVEGRELALTEPPWEADPVAWSERSHRARVTAREGSAQEFPLASPDGNLLAWHEGGLVVQAVNAADLGALSGVYLDDARDRARLLQIGRQTAREPSIRPYRVAWSPSGGALIATGSEDHGAPADLDGRDWNQLLLGEIDNSDGRLSVNWAPIPGTLRATEAAWSPDEQTVAFIRQSDGTHNIWTVRLDGEDRPRELTRFRDGTQLQGISWTPDGDHLLVSMIRNYQQDLWLYSPGDDDWGRLTDSAADETDPVIGPDGRAWFTSDMGGVFDVYSMNLDTRAVRRHTRLVGGAYGASATLDGNLLYTGLTGHGFRAFGLPKARLADAPAAYPGRCDDVTPSSRAGACTDTGRFLAYEADLSVDPARDSRQYVAVGALLPPVLTPLLRVDGANAEAGARFRLADAAEQMGLWGLATIGSSRRLRGVFQIDALWPTLQVGGDHRKVGDNLGLRVASDTATEEVIERRVEMARDEGWALIRANPSATLRGDLVGERTRLRFRDSGDAGVLSPFSRHDGLGVILGWSPGPTDPDPINPQGGRETTLGWQLRATRLLDPRYDAIVDDGEVLSSYRYHLLRAHHSEYIPLGHHTVQLDLDAGWIDRNVMPWDEISAGGLHPMSWSGGSLQTPLSFPGFGAWTLSGETALLAGLAWRIPLAREIDRPLGPLHVDGLVLQLFGHAGNLWGYRPIGTTTVVNGSVVADDPATIQREVPFSDHASGLSPEAQPVNLLSDVGAELRLRSFIRNDWDWDSFLRVAWGMQDVSGTGDIDGDGLVYALPRAAFGLETREVEPSTVRIYLGLGTGW